MCGATGHDLGRGLSDADGQEKCGVKNMTLRRVNNTIGSFFGEIQRAGEPTGEHTGVWSMEDHT